MDRLDYLKRDSFYTGVSEGVISSDRIIDMLNVIDDELVVDAKGIYSIENFLVSRRLMYWQVYLHKTVIAAENLLLNILKRAKHLINNGDKLFATPALERFLIHQYHKDNFLKNPELLELFAQLDDNDIIASIKAWTHSPDRILSRLCKNLINRNLYKIRLYDQPIPKKTLEEKQQQAMNKHNIDKDMVHYFVFTGAISNNAYDKCIGKIYIFMKDRSLKDIDAASDHLNISTLSETVTRYYICFPSY
jgi:hypothetical protein